MHKRFQSYNINKGVVVHFPQAPALVTLARVPLLRARYHYASSQFRARRPTGQQNNDVRSAETCLKGETMKYYREYTNLRIRLCATGRFAKSSFKRNCLIPRTNRTKYVFQSSFSTSKLKVWEKNPTSVRFSWTIAWRFKRSRHVWKCLDRNGK